MKKSYVFVSSAYGKDKKTSLYRAQEYCDQVMQCGAVPFSPQVFLDTYMDPNDPEEYRMGEKIAEAVLKESAVLCLCDAGPDDRVKREIATAEKAGIPLIPLESLEAAAAALGTVKEEAEPEQAAAEQTMEIDSEPESAESEPVTDPVPADPYASMINPNWRK